MSVVLIMDIQWMQYKQTLDNNKTNAQSYRMQFRIKNKTKENSKDYKRLRN